jgi:hypothetical protein
MYRHDFDWAPPPPPLINDVVEPEEPEGLVTFFNDIINKYILFSNKYIMMY